MNPVIEITVQKVWEPFATAKPWRDGKKRGKIVSSEGDNYQVAETMLREFGEGRVYKVEFKTFGDKANPGKEIVKKIWTGDEGIPNPPALPTRQRTNPTDRDDIMLAVLIKEARFDAWPTSDIVQLIRKHEEVIRLARNPQRSEVLADEIPFFPKSENPAD